MYTPPVYNPRYKGEYRVFPSFIILLENNA